MNILVNYDPDDKEHLPQVAGILKKFELSGKATSESFGISDLLAAAKKVDAAAILLANTKTLANCVQVQTKTQATLSTFRGSRLNFSTPAIVCAPFKQLQTTDTGKFLLEIDIGKIKKVKTLPIQLKFKVLENQDDFDAACRVLESCLVISIDIETDGYRRITCLSFTGLLPNLRTTTYVIPFVDFGLDHWQNASDYAAAIQCMQEICGNPVPKLFFNGNYDVQYLISYNAYPNNWVLDSMGLMHSQYSELPKALDFGASIHCYDYYYWKLEAALSSKNKDIRGYWGYCAKDSWYALRIFINMIETEYPAYAIKNYQQLFKLCYPCLYCSYEGVKVDETLRAESRAKRVIEMEKRLKSLRTMTACATFNPGSPLQTAMFLYDIIGAKPVKRRKKGGKPGEYEIIKSTDKKILENKVAPQHPLLAIIIDDIINYRKDVKAISTYHDFKLLNGRLLYSMSPFTTDTARFSCNASNFRMYDVEEGEIVSYGTQIQNQPPYTKHFIMADEDFEMAEADNNKSEARCVAELANCAALRAALNDPEKEFYKSLGTLFFGIPYTDVTKELRNAVLKRIVHASNYMLGVETFITNVGPKKILEGAEMLKIRVTDMEAFVKYLLSVYHKPFPEIQKVLWVETKREVLLTKKLVSPLNYTRYFFGDIQEDHAVLRAAIAHRPQNLSVGVLNKGFWRVYKELVLPSEGKVRLKNQIHDAIMVQYPPHMREEVKTRMLACMDNPVLMPNGQVLRIPVDYHWGKTWKDIKDQ